MGHVVQLKTLTSLDDKMLIMVLPRRENEHLPS